MLQQTVISWPGVSETGSARLAAEPSRTRRHLGRTANPDELAHLRTGGQAQVQAHALSRGSVLPRKWRAVRFRLQSAVAGPADSIQEPSELQTHAFFAAFLCVVDSPSLGRQSEGAVAPSPSTQAGVWSTLPIESPH